MRHWKVIATAAAFAAVVSILFGLIGSVAFGSIVVRMLLCAALFAGLGYVAIFALEKYVPEVLDLAAAVSDSNAEAAAERGTDGDAAVAASALGGRLDITLPEENPHTLGSRVAPVDFATARTADREPAMLEDGDFEDAVGQSIAVDPVAAADDSETDSGLTAGDIEPLESVEGTESGAAGLGGDELADIGNMEVAPDAATQAESSDTQTPYGSAKDLASAIRTAMSRE